LTFGSFGTVVVPGGGTEVGDQYISDGKIVALVGNSNGILVDRFDPDGSVDTTFGTNGSSAVLTVDVGGQPQQLSLPSYLTGDKSLTVLPDGDMLVAGSIPVPSVGQVATLMMLRPDGTLDGLFNGDGILELPYASGASFVPAYVVDAAETNGHILVLARDGGNNEPGGGNEALFQFNLDGAIDTTFGSGGEVSSLPIADDPSLLLAPGGKILVGVRERTPGYFGGTEQLYRYNADGTPDMTFGTAGLVTLPGYYGPAFDNNIAVQPDGKLILTSDAIGTDSNDNYIDYPCLYRLNADGSLDASFGAGGYIEVPIPTATQFTNPALTTVEPDGRILSAIGNWVLYGIVGDPVVSFGGATSYTTSGGTPTALYDVPETAGSATITLERGGDLCQPLSVPFSTDDSGGHGGVNYTPVNTIVTFAAGSATATVTVPILVDPDASPAVDVPLILGTPSGAAVLGTYAVGDLHIEPTEGIVISATQIPSVAEQGPSSTFTVALQTVPQGDVTIPLSISTTSPAASLSASSLVFTPADALTPQTVTVAAVSGSGAEGSTPAIATVTVGPATSTDPKYNGLAGGTVQVGVHDDGASNPGFIELAAPNFSDDENAAKATITLLRLGGSSGSVTVHFATSDGSSKANGDYTPLSGSITFGPGVTSRTFSITLTDSGYNLDGDQTVDLTLSDPTGGAQLGVFPTATLTLHDPYTLSAGDLDAGFGTDGSAVLPDTIASNGGSSQGAPNVFAVLPGGNGNSDTRELVGRTNRRAHPFSEPGGGLRPSVSRRLSCACDHWT